MPFNAEEFYLKTPMGHEIHVSSFGPAGEEPKGIIVISSATGVLQKYYAKFAQFLSHHQYRVYTFDYYGIGNSSSDIRDLKKNDLSIQQWGSNDQASVLKMAKERSPSTPLTLITHSIGGQILGFNPSYHLLDKIVMVSPQSGYWRYYEGLHYPKMWLFWNAMIPVLTPLYGYFPAKKLGLFENLPKKMVYEWAKWGRHKEYMFGHIDTEKAFFDKIECPLLVLGFPRDIYAPKAATDWLAGKYENARIDRRHLIPEEMGIDDVRHFGFFRSKFEDPLWKITKEWIEN
ncbi:alpha/beta fold hydrolase [Leptobacterium flavescens]|uniref:Alpha/beta fold hydrolase n=1 Tax=Leptobacterium flavescens TaxID=472055 RepID=A0A6P0UPP6_9FLAO|nr:alpha/beta fold hydrolase [Leptobacterium flavescens]NER15301.1 alpha/beta fold hydrolase [Leptobacterium flavescens]